ncbi:uncharacterized protein LOC123715082 [Pieris brassicae]|uniref:uncharacterized protein LOC123715082 n=1 Tax=Pieris brassicae TaxID=7116 RepID=UPI001E661E82|nr:uncharacterized protein LOC123715082 [Pieris brassicae]
MSSDIDIEEHDVLEHPSIKKIFPDLSWIKTEFISLDDEESTVFKNIRIETTSESQCVEEFEQRNDPVQDNEVIILDDVQCPGLGEKNELTLETGIRSRNVDTEPIIVEDEECEDVFETYDNMDKRTRTKAGERVENVPSSILLLQARQHSYFSKIQSLYDLTLNLRKEDEKLFQIKTSNIQALRTEFNDLVSQLSK